jgi:hypothetical protein
MPGGRPCLRQGFGRQARTMKMVHYFSDSSGFCVGVIPPLVTPLYSPLSLRGDEGGLGEL